MQGVKDTVRWSPPRVFSPAFPSTGYDKEMAGQDLAKLYDEDLYIWSCRNAQLLREGRFAEADMENIAEEIESLGKEQVHGLESQIRRLLLHLLKYQCQPARRTRNWQVSMVNARIKIEEILAENPSLRPRTLELVRKAYTGAVRQAAVETDLPKNTFPAECPYTFDQIIEDDFLPE
jgi:hypothetical protein